MSPSEEKGRGREMGGGIVRGVGGQRKELEAERGTRREEETGDGWRRAGGIK